MKFEKTTNKNILYDYIFYRNSYLFIFYSNCFLDVTA